MKSHVPPSVAVVDGVSRSSQWDGVGVCLWAPQRWRCFSKYKRLLAPRHILTSLPWLGLGLSRLQLPQHGGSSQKIKLLYRPADPIQRPPLRVMFSK